MSVLNALLQVWILIPVATLIVAGLYIALRSGQARLSDGQGVRQLVGNLSSTVAMIVVCLVLLMLAQGAVGYNLTSNW